MYVQNRCVNELQARTEWRTIALAMSQAKQTEWENKICGCASEEAPNQITAAQLPELLTESGRVKVAAEVTAKTVTACYKRLFTKYPQGSLKNQNTLSGCLNPIPHPPRQPETKFNTAQIHAAPNSQKEAP